VTSFIIANKQYSVIASWIESLIIVTTN